MPCETLLWWAAGYTHIGRKRKKKDAKKGGKKRNQSRAMNTTGQNGCSFSIFIFIRGFSEAKFNWWTQSLTEKVKICVSDWKLKKEKENKTKTNNKNKQQTYKQTNMKTWKLHINAWLERLRTRQRNGLLLRECIGPFIETSKIGTTEQKMKELVCIRVCDVVVATTKNFDWEEWEVEKSDKDYHYL